MHALVIEDDAMTAWLIEEELRDLGFCSVEIAATEQEAVAAAHRKRPQLITSDGHLGQGNGVDAVRVICTGASVPVVFITGDPARARAMAPPAVILEKPFGAHLLAAAVRQVTQVTLQ